MILITGGSGVMGRRLVKMLCEAGNEIRLFTLPDDKNVELIKQYVVDIRYGDIAKEGDVTDICRGVDTVYHCAAVIVTDDERHFKKVNVGGTQHLVREAIKEKVNHFIFISSASVVYPKTTPYSLSKRRCEKIVSTSGLNFTIIRPTLVYDKGKGGQEFDMFLSYLNRYPILPFIGNGGALKRPVFVDDIINGLVALNRNEATFGKVYNFSGGEALSMIQFAKLCLIILGMKNRTVIHLPIWFCKVIAALLKRVMKRPPITWQVIAGVTQDADLDPREAMMDLGYNPARVSERLIECFPRN